MIQQIKELIAQKADTTVALAREIWGYAELSYEETRSAAALINALKAEGFTIEDIPEDEFDTGLNDYSDDEEDM